MSTSEGSPGHKALLQCTSELTSLLKHNLSACSGKLLEKGLITEAVHDWVLTAQGVSNQDKAARLVSCLTDRVKGSTQQFHDFIQVLKETDPFCGDIVDKLNQSLTESRATSIEDEKKQVGVTIKNLEKQFSSLQRRLSTELNANSEVSPEILLESLTLLPIALRSEYKKFILENLQTLEKADSIRKIFHHLNPHLSFIDYHLVEYLVEEFASKRLQRDMSVYVETVEVFYDETTVQQLMDYWPGRRDIPPHFEELSAVIDEDPGTYTLRKLDNLRKEFCSEIRLFETVLILKRFGRKNSFVVRWVFPSTFVPQLKPVISSLRSFYQRKHIFSVTVGRQRLYSIAAEYEERLLSLCSTGTGDISEIRYLLSQPGLDTNIFDKKGYTPLYYANRQGRNDLLQLLLEHGAEVDLPNDNEWGNTALTGARIGGHVTTAVLPIEKGAAVNYINKDQNVKGFEITLETMKEVEGLLTSDFIKGLSEEGNHVIVKMLLTFVHSIPNGTENGEFLALDLGGSNYRVWKIRIEGGLVKDLDSAEYTIPKAKIIQTQEVLFDFVAEHVVQFIKDRKITRKLPMGFTFSFPVLNTSLTSGTLVRWTKCFDADGAVGEDPVRLLKEAFDRKGVNIDTHAVPLISDTTGTLLAVAGKEVPDCHIGLILGTGTNACYMEKFDAATIPKHKGDFGKHSHIVINCEWGAFGDDGKLEKWRTKFDKQLDNLTVNPGEQLYEKLISGKYLGETVRQALLSLIKDGSLFGGKSSTKFDTFEKFETKYLSYIEGGDVNVCMDLLKEDFSIEASKEDCEVVRRVCEAVSTRAARLAATGIVALVKKIDKLDSCTVAVDGSLYKKHPKFPHRMRVAMDELAPGNNIKIELSKDGSGRGAAIAAAIACRDAGD